MIIGLSGYARSGKDSIAKVLVDNYGFIRLAFADPVRELLLEIDPILDKGNRLSSLVDEYGWDIAKAQPEVRRLLQTLGFGARKIFGDNFWVDQVINQFGHSWWGYDTNVVITDVRFTNEAQGIKGKGGQLWRVNRPGVKAINDHISESELDNYPVDCIFVNDTTIEDLELAVKTRMQGMVK